MRAREDAPAENRTVFIDKLGGRIPARMRPPHEHHAGCGVGRGVGRAYAGRPGGRAGPFHTTSYWTACVHVLYTTTTTDYGHIGGKEQDYTTTDYGPPPDYGAAITCRLKTGCQGRLRATAVVCQGLV